MISARQQSAMYFARRRHKLNALVGSLTPWSEGLTVTNGQFVQSNGGVYRAQDDGTTGSVAPSGTAALIADDGTSPAGVKWIFVDNQTLLQYLGTTPPTPA